MDAVGCAEFFLEMERLVGVGLAFVSDHIVRTADHAPSAAGAQPAGDDLVVEFLPLVVQRSFFVGAVSVTAMRGTQPPIEPGEERAVCTRYLSLGG